MGCHAMPFGAAVESGGVRFRLWAPDAAKVELLLAEGEGERCLAMAATGEGWHELMTAEARAGSRYRYRIDGGLAVPDPASRFQPDDVHGASEVIDPADFDWKDGGWRGRPWEETVFYELHVGAFTERGDFAAVADKLDYLARLGVTAIELMPVADFPGRRNWGYDGTLLFAPDASYGRPEDLKRLVQEAHRRGLMIFLDVVYNHFGPEGNYLHSYAEPFFTDRHRTPWGNANNFDGPESRMVRDFFIHNAMYWLEEYRFDGLRLDAVHAIMDDGDKHFLEELAERVRQAIPDRQVHLVLENDDNAARFLERGPDGRPHWYEAQWNDDLHHVCHVLATDESGGYYGDYAGDPMRLLGRALTEGFAYQGEPSAYRGGAGRGSPSKHLPPPAFVSFLQNHDQVGNRALGERLNVTASPEAARALTALLLLAPQVPLLFMGQEWGAEQPFLYFCDFHDELAEAVREGRRREFDSFPQFRHPKARENIPDPNAEATFLSSRLDWADLGVDPHRGWHDLTHDLLYLRRRYVLPRLSRITDASCDLWGKRTIKVRWPDARDGSALVVHANLGPDPADAVEPPTGRLIFGTHGAPDALPAWSVTWYIEGVGQE